MSCIAWLSKLNIWKRLIEAIQELICLKGVLMIEIGIHLVDPITFMDDVKSAITLVATARMRMGRSILNVSVTIRSAQQACQEHNWQWQGSIGFWWFSGE